MLLYLIKELVIFLIALAEQNTVFIKMISILLATASFILPIVLYGKSEGYVPFLHSINAPACHEIGKKRSKTVFLFIFAFSLLISVLNGVGFLTDFVFSLFGKSFENTLSLSPFDVAYTIIRSVIFAAFLEEMLFRGVVLHAFSKRPAVAKILFSGLLFASSHYNLYQFFYAFAAGTVIALFAVVTNSLLFSVLLHLGSNFMTFIFSILKIFLSSEKYTAVSLFVFSATATVSIVCTIIYIFKFYKINDPSVPLKKSEIPKEIFVYITASLLLSIINIL